MAERLHGPTIVLDKRRKRDAPSAAFVADKEVVKEHAQWRDSESRPPVGASRSSAVVGLEAAISARVADEYNRVLGRGSTEGGETAHANLVREAEAKWPDAWKSSQVSNPLRAGDVGKPAVGIRWVL